MDGDYGQPNDGNKALKVVGIVLASLFALTLVCCGGAWFLGGRLVTEISQATGAQVQGSGVPAVQERLVTDFTGVETEGLIDVEITVGPDWKVMVRADDNILPLIATEVRGNTLHFTTRGSYDAQTDVHATITMPAVDHVTTRGLGDVTVTGVSGASFTAEVHGLGSIAATGTVDAVSVTSKGQGDADLFGLVARTAEVSINGIGDVEVHATESLKAEVNGMGDVTYKGNPPQVEKQVNGIGDVEPAE